VSKGSDCYDARRLPCISTRKFCMLDDVSRPMPLAELDPSARSCHAVAIGPGSCRSRFAWRRIALLVPVLFVMLMDPVTAAEDGPETLAADALDRFNEALSDKSVPMLEEALFDFHAVYDKVPEKTVKKFHRAYGKLFKLEPREEIREDGSDPRDELLRAYQLALGTVFDKPGGDALILSGLKLGHIKRWPEAQALFVEALGFRADPKNIKTLASYVKSDQAPVVRAAVHGLGMFSESGVDVRRTAVKPLVDALAACSKAAAKEAKKGKEEEAQEYFLAVEGTFYDALLKLTRQQFDSAAEYAEWFKKNGAGDSW